MKKTYILLTLLISLASLSLVRANDNNYRGIDLGEYAFGIPVEQLGFDNNSTFSISFWMYVKEYNHHIECGTNFLSIRNIAAGLPLGDNGYMYTYIGYPLDEDFGNKIVTFLRPYNSAQPFMKTNDKNPSEVNLCEWKYFTFVFDIEQYRKLTIYIDGVSSYESKMLLTSYSWQQNFDITIGGPASKRASLNALIDKVQVYNKTLTSDEIIESMTAPLLNDGALLGYWDFEDGCTTDSEGFMQADNGEIKATMYKILQQESGSYAGGAIGKEIQPFVFTEGVDPESVIQGVEESVTEETKTKAYISNGVLYIENADGINSVEVYNSLGTPLYRRGAGCEDSSLQIALSSTIRGVLFVKVNNEVVKVIN